MLTYWARKYLNLYFRNVMRIKTPKNLEMLWELKLIRILQHIVWLFADFFPWRYWQDFVILYIKLEKYFTHRKFSSACCLAIMPVIALSRVIKSSVHSRKLSEVANKRKLARLLLTGHMHESIKPIRTIGFSELVCPLMSWSMRYKQENRDSPRPTLFVFIGSFYLEPCRFENDSHTLYLQHK